MKPVVVLIAAVARNGVIGREGGLPWHLPEDLRRFREATLGHAVLMGRATWDSLPDRFRPLPGRRNLVLTRQANWHAGGATALPTLQAAIGSVAVGEKLFVIGGATVYAAALRHADELMLTALDRDFDGDARFPPFDRADWVEVERQAHETPTPDGFGYAFVRLVRQKPIGPGGVASPVDVPEPR